MTIEIKGEKYYTLKELTKITGISVTTLKKYCNEKRLAAQKVARSWIVSESNLKKFMDRTE